MRNLGLLLVTTLVARLAKQLAVLLLRHTLATLLDDGSHGPSSTLVVAAGVSTGRPRDTAT